MRYCSCERCISQAVRIKWFTAKFPSRYLHPNHTLRNLTSEHTLNIYNPSTLDRYSVHTLLCHY